MTNSEKMERVAEAREGREADEAGETVVAGKLGPEPARSTVAPFHHDPANPTHLDLARFAAWRATKCTPFDPRAAGAGREELIKGTLELTGEIGEVGELIGALNDGVERDSPAFRRKLVDECGDVIFCLSWLGDAWGVNPLRDPAANAWAAEYVVEPHVKENPERYLFYSAYHMGVLGGLLANAAKKVVCQGRSQPRATQLERLGSILDFVAAILGMVDSSIAEALARNIEKLDARWPTGAPMTGGGNRTGKGA